MRFFIAKKCISFFFFLFLLTNSGLCSIFRSEAGGQDEAVAAGAEDEPAYRNNSHLFDADACGRSNHVGYYDAAALYPSSGTLLLLLLCTGRGKGRERKGNPVHPGRPTSQPPHTPTPPLPPPLP
jgi:hypothetical protein